MVDDATDPLVALWRQHATYGAGSGAPLHRALVNLVADDPTLMAVVRAAPPWAHPPTNLLAAVHFLVLGGITGPLADSYRDVDIAAAVHHFGPFVLEHRDELLAVMATRPIQTNEVTRVAVIAPPVALAARLAGRPVALVDVGASGGLNLLLDRYRIDYGRLAIGPESSPVVVTCRLEGDLRPADVALDIGWRIGLDRSPIDLTDAGDALWLRACTWPEHHDRHHRLAAAIGLARDDPPTVVAGDAVEALPDLLRRAPSDLHTVVTTTWVMSYLAPPDRAGFVQALRTAGRPVSWVSLDLPGVVDLDDRARPPAADVYPNAVGLVTFAGDGSPPRRRRVAWAHPHGRWLIWEGARECFR